MGVRSEDSECDDSVGGRTERRQAMSDIKAAIARQQQVQRGESVEDVYAACYERNEGPSPSDDRDAILRFILSHPFGVLKPLEWVKFDAGAIPEIYYAETMFGTYYVRRQTSGDCRYETPDVECMQACDSIDHGKQLCEQHYAAETAKAFTTIGEAT